MVTELEKRQDGLISAQQVRIAELEKERQMWEDKHREVSALLIAERVISDKAAEHKRVKYDELLTKLQSVARPWSLQEHPEAGVRIVTRLEAKQEHVVGQWCEHYLVTNTGHVIYYTALLANWATPEGGICGWPKVVPPPELATKPTKLVPWSLKRHPSGEVLVRNKATASQTRPITEWMDSGARVYGSGAWTYKHLLESWEQPDGSLCGYKEEVQ